MLYSFCRSNISGRNDQFGLNLHAYTQIHRQPREKRVPERVSVEVSEIYVIKYQSLRCRVILLIDNYDSFTYNLFHYLGELGADVRVLRNDEVTADTALALKPDGIVLSPGPCTPNEAG